MMKKNFWAKKSLFRSEKTIGPARAGKKKSKKFGSTNYRPGIRTGPARPGYPARPSIPEFPFHGSYIQFHDRGSLRPRVLEAQVPSVPRSHRSQGPIGPPKVSHPRYPTQGIPGNPYMVWFSGIGIIQWHWNNSVALE